MTKKDRAGRPKGIKLVSYTCNHWAEYEGSPPMLGDRVFCRKCNAYKEVVDYIDDHRIKCQHCRISRSYGACMDDARRAASRHVMRKPTHIVSVYRNTDVILVVDYPAASDIPHALASERVVKSNTATQTLKTAIENLRGKVSDT